MDNRDFEYGEDKDRVNDITNFIFLPALQEAFGEARHRAPFTEVVSASLNAYRIALIQILGQDVASSVLQSLSEHVKSAPKKDESSEH